MSSDFSNPLAADLKHVLARTRQVWEPLRGENIFVTGGTGFFGRWLLESFAYVEASLGLGARMVVLTRNPESFAAKAPHLSQNPGISFVQGDVRNLPAANLPDTRFTYVIHAATESGTNLGAEDPRRMFDTIVNGTRAVLDFAQKRGARRFLFTSSGAIYGKQPSELTHVPEEYVGAPDCTQAGSAYGEGKRAAELLCACYANERGLEPVIARCFAFVGPFLPLDGHFAIGNFLRDALAGRSIKVGGDGTPYRSYLHAADLAIWLWTILFNGETGRAYNVGSEDGHTIAEIAHLVSKIGGAPTVEIAGVADPAKPTTRYIPSCRRAHDELKLQQWIDLPSAIRRTLAVLRAQQTNTVA